MPTVLIVDDNALVRQLVEQQLDGDYDVLGAANGAIGVELARAKRPDVVLMDLAMPVMDGWDAIRALRADATTVAIPIIALSATSEAEDIARALAAGATTYVPKPIDEPALRNAIARSLAGSGTRLRETLPTPVTLPNAAKKALR
jgi:CheY-like chemotaxis protein